MVNTCIYNVVIKNLDSRRKLVPKICLWLLLPSCSHMNQIYLDLYAEFKVEMAVS